MVKFIQVNKFGGPEVLSIKNRENRPLGHDDALVRHVAIGINYTDILARKGVYNISTPFTPGVDAVGIVEEVGKNVDNVEVGDRVTYLDPNFGAYCESRVLNSKKLIDVPDYVDSDEVASILVKGIAAHFLTRRTFYITNTSKVLIQGAACGVGLLMIQMIKSLGAQIVATTTTPEKQKILKEHGADLVLDVKDTDLYKKVIDFTGGWGVHVAYDFYGQETLKASHDCLGLFSLLVPMGYPQGALAEISSIDIYKKSTFVTCPNFFNYQSSRLEQVLSANEIFGQLQKKMLKPLIYKKYRLDQVQEAHQNIEDRLQIGQSIFSV